MRCSHIDWSKGGVGDRVLNLKSQVEDNVNNTILFLLLKW